uniref:Uncharacterized protein LOC105128495 isoform X1 n=1 Tax=Rhizophora mucronata TaxID=61149 RepID=A0A2P2MFL4_RHIMU
MRIKKWRIRSLYFSRSTPPLSSESSSLPSTCSPPSTPPSTPLPPPPPSPPPGSPHLLLPRFLMWILIS